MTEEIQHKRPKIKTIIEIFSHLMEVKKDWKMLSVLLVFLVILISSEPFFYKWMIGAVEQKKNLVEIFQIIGIWTLATLGLMIVRYIYGVRLLNRGSKDFVALLMKLTQKMHHLPIEYHRNIQAGEKYKIVDRAAEALWAVADNYILVIFPQILVSITLVIGGFIIDPIFTLYSLVFLPFGIGGVSFFGRRAYKKQKVASKFWDSSFDRMLDGFVNIPVIRMFARQKRERQELDNRFEKASIAQLSVRKNWAQFNAFGRFFTIIASMITVSAGVILLSLGKTDFATFFFFIAFTQRVYGPIMEIFNSIQVVMEKLSYYEKAQEILQMTPERDDGVATLTPVKQSIEFQHITFSYPSSDRVILDDISLSVRRGEKVAFVGHTGSGKSTIIQLLMRFYEPQSGVISIDGQDIYDFSLDSYRSRFGTVFQDTTLFNDTLRHNLSYVRDGITEEQILEACEKANVGEFVGGLELGLDTVVGERGLKLSGGERQRIAIARAILADPDILILDEATSALDTKTEKVVQKAFDTLMEGRTSIIIAHRLSTIMGADRIYMLDHGQIIGSGSHTDLYSSCEQYREMVDLQHDGIVGESDQQSDDSE